MANENTLKVIVVCPKRDGNFGWGSAGRYFTPGRHDLELPEETVRKMQDEIARGESILTIIISGEEVAAPSAPAAPAAGAAAAEDDDDDGEPKRKPKGFRK